MVAGGDETLMLEALVLCDGQPIAVVSNASTGGCHLYRPLEAGGWAAIRAFEEYATEWGRQQTPAVRFEPHDQIVYDLIDDRVGDAAHLPVKRAPNSQLTCDGSFHRPAPHTDRSCVQR